MFKFGYPESIQIFPTFGSALFIIDSNPKIAMKIFIRMHLYLNLDLDFAILRPNHFRLLLPPQVKFELNPK